MMLNDIFLLLLLFQSLQNVQVKAFSTSSIHSCYCCNTRAFTIPASSAIIYKKERQVKTCKTTLSVVTAAAKRRNIGALWTFAKGGTQEEQQSMQSMECDTENDSTHHSLSPKALSTATTFKKSPSHFLSSLQFWKKHKEEGTDSLTFKQKLAKAGMSTLLSYGFVSNMSYAVTVSIAWYISAKRSGLSPLTKGQWPGFLAIYSGFYVFNNIVRPARFALSIGVSQYFDSAVNGIQRSLKCSKPVAVGILVVLANVFGTSLAMGLGIFLASKAAGIPVRPR